MNTNRSTMNRFAMPLALLVIAALAAGLLFQSLSYNAIKAEAQAANPSASQPATITVTANGQASAQPDVAIINVGVQTQGATAREALDKHNQALNTVTAKLKELKIADADVQTTGFGIYPNYGSDGRQVQSYTASSNLTIKVQDISSVGNTLDALVSAGANTAGGVSFALKDDQQLQAQALANAVANARPKAEAIARQMGVSITGISTVVENDSNPSPRPMMAGAMANSADSVPVQSGELTANASVTVIFTYGK